MRKNTLGWLAALAGWAAGPAIAADVRLVASPSIETVYRWKEAGCPDGFIPDSPARAYRRADGSVVLMAAHHTNGFLAGPDLASLRPRCDVQSGGHESARPEDFDDRFWVQALWPLGGGRLLGLVSHEYLGQRHPGRCRLAAKPGPPRCWYSSILTATATEAEFRFTLPPLPERIVAAPPAPYDPDGEARVGFLTATNIVRAGDWLYMASWVEIPGTRGNCLFRTAAATPAGPWLALSRGAFTARFPGAYAGGDTGAGRCDPIGPEAGLGTLRSLVRLERHGVFAAVFSVANGQSRAAGIYYSLSADLVRWGPATLLTPLRPWYGTMDCQAFYDYPSLIDRTSRSPVFETAGETMDLYLTRFNWGDCRRGLDRDLVRVPVRVEVAAP